MELSKANNIRFNKEDVKLIKIDGYIIYTGKNLFDVEAFVADWNSKANDYAKKVMVDGEVILEVCDGPALWKKEKGFPIRVEQGKKYVFSFDCRSIDGSTTNGIFCLRSGDSQYYPACKTTTWSHNSVPITAEEDYIYVCSGYNNNLQYYVKNIRLELASEQEVLYLNYNQNYTIRVDQ